MDSASFTTRSCRMRCARATTAMGSRSITVAFESNTRSHSDRTIRPRASTKGSGAIATGSETENVIGNEIGSAIGSANATAIAIASVHEARAAIGRGQSLRPTQNDDTAIDHGHRNTSTIFKAKNITTHSVHFLLISFSHITFLNIMKKCSYFG